MRAPTKAQTPDVMTALELADYLRCHQSTIYRMVRRRELPAFRVGSDWRFEKKAIDAWLTSQSARHL
jgi:excisionase family DNA binding protein